LSGLNNEVAAVTHRTGPAGPTRNPVGCCQHGLRGIRNCGGEVNPRKNFQIGHVITHMSTVGRGNAEFGHAPIEGCAFVFGALDYDIKSQLAGAYLSRRMGSSANDSQPNARLSERL
jgi:hypothetical protein